MFLRSLFVASFAALVAGSAFAQSAYAVDTNEDLYVVNLATGATTFVGNTGVFLEGLAYSMDTGRLFGTDTSGTLHELNRFTGAVVNSWTGTGGMEGLDASGNTLFMTDFNNPTHFLGWDASSNSSIGNWDTISNDGPARAMAFNQQGDGLLYFVGDQPNFQTLWKGDLGVAATSVGSLNSDHLVAAIDFDGNTLWALDEVGNVGQINTSTGAFTVTGSTGNHFWLDMSMTTVPEPGTMAVLGLGALALLRRRRK